jgi:hypothetical protein
MKRRTFTRGPPLDRKEQMYNFDTLQLIPGRPIMLDSASPVPLGAIVRKDQPAARAWPRDCTDEKCASGERTQARRRHALHCCELASQAEADWEALPAAAWQARYRPRIDDIRAALAWAFDAGGDGAIGARLMAASTLMWIELSLLDEQRAWIEQALPNAGSREDEMLLQAAMGNALFHLDGAHSEAIAAFARAFQLAGELGDIVPQARAYSGLCANQLLGGDYEVARATGAAFAFFLGRTDAPAARRIYERMMAVTLHFCGDQTRSRVHAERVYRQPATLRRDTRHSGVYFDQRVAATTILSRIRWLQGFPRQALALAHEAVERALAIDHPVSLCYALALGACPVAFWVGERAIAADFLALLTERSTRFGFVQWQLWARQYAALESSAAAGGPRLTPGPLDETLATLSARHAAPADFERAEQGLSGWCGAELLRLKGEAMLSAGAPTAAVEAVYRRSLALAESQGAPAWQLRTATSLARLLGGQRHSGAGLEAVYLRFIEGLDTRDLVAARELLRQLGRLL